MENKEKIEEEKITIGNVSDSSIINNYKGWLVGHFIQPPTELNYSKEVEVKWGVHNANEKKGASGLNHLATTLTILINGRFLMEFPELDRKIMLSKIGDFIIFPPGISHCWAAETDSVVLTIRWPSIENDQTLI